MTKNMREELVKLCLNEAVMKSTDSEHIWEDLLKMVGRYELLLAIFRSEYLIKKEKYFSV